MLSSEVSLVKYDNGILISTKDARGKVRSLSFFVEHIFPLTPPNGGFDEEG